MAELKNNSNRRRNILIVFYINVAMNIINILHDLSENALLERALIGNYEDAELELTDNITRV